MSWLRQGRPHRMLAITLGLGLLALLVLPIIALGLSSSPSDLLAGIQHPLFVPALSLSARTTAISLAVIITAGTPLAWWLASNHSRRSRAVELLVDLPIVLPPAVVGVALLQTFGRNGLLGPITNALEIQVPFTSVAVVLAQVVVAAPFYVQAAANAFREVDLDLIIVARTLGASPASAFFRVAIPVAAPGLVSGTALAWARAMGEFGATLLFAGNLSGTTQTMPLAIYTTLESDVHAALAIALLLAAVALMLLFTLRLGPRLLSRRHSIPVAKGVR